MNLLIITPTRGTSPWLRETVTSVAELKLPRRHVVVAPAPARAALAALAPQAEIVAEERGGLYAALNRGLGAGGAWDAFTWINDDDLLCAPGFARLTAEFERRPEVDVMFGRVSLIDRSGARLGELPVARRSSDLPALLAGGIVPFAQPGMVVRRRAWEGSAGFDPSYRLAGDLDFFVRLLAGGARFEFVDAEVACFRLSAGQLSKQREDVERETARAIQAIAPVRRSSVARWRFRLSNLPVYVERVRRHGWRSMRQMYDRVD